MNVKIYDVYLGENRLPYLHPIDFVTVEDVHTYDIPEKIVNLINEVFSASQLAEEHIWELVFDVKMHLIAIFDVNHGSSTESYANISGILRRCLLSGTGFVICHNHPSGDSQESKEDLILTKKLNEASKIIEVRLIDHIIIGKNEFKSLRESGIIA